MPTGIRNRSTVNPDAPHGYGADGLPLAPYGLKADGRPRKSNRGARPGQQGNATPPATAEDRPNAVEEALAYTISPADIQRMRLINGLAETFVCAPLAAASGSRILAKRIGPEQTNALAADAYAIGHYMPGISQGLVIAAQAKPGLLAWLDVLEDRAPYLLLLQSGIELGRALISNHTRPNAQIADQGRAWVGQRVAQAQAQAMAEAQQAQRQAAAMMTDPDVTDFDYDTGDIGNAGADEYGTEPMFSEAATSEFIG